MDLFTSCMCLNSLCALILVFQGMDINMYYLNPAPPTTMDVKFYRLTIISHLLVWNGK